MLSGPNATSSPMWIPYRRAISYRKPVPPVTTVWVSSNLSKSFQAAPPPTNPARLKRFQNCHRSSASIWAVSSPW